MPTPKITDAEGRELKRGMKVKRDWNQDEVRHLGWHADDGWVVGTLAMPVLPTVAGEDRDTWVCPSLLVDTEDSE